MLADRGEDRSDLSFVRRSFGWLAYLLKFLNLGLWGHLVGCGDCGLGCVALLFAFTNPAEKFLHAACHLFGAGRWQKVSSGTWRDSHAIAKLGADVGAGRF